MKYWLSVVALSLVFLYINLQSFKEKESEENNSAMEQNLLLDFNLKESKLDTPTLDPFKALLYRKKRFVHKKPRPVKEVETPNFSINSIMWGGNPVVLLKRNGQTKVSKQGDVVWGWTILTINKDSILLIKDGNKYTLTK